MLSFRVLNIIYREMFLPFFAFFIRRILNFATIGRLVLCASLIFLLLTTLIYLAVPTLQTLHGKIVLRLLNEN